MPLPLRRSAFHHSSCRRTHQPLILRQRRTRSTCSGLTPTGTVHCCTRCTCWRLSKSTGLESTRGSSQLLRLWCLSTSPRYTTSRATCPRFVRKFQHHTSCRRSSPLHLDSIPSSTSCRQPFPGTQRKLLSHRKSTKPGPASSGTSPPRSFRTSQLPWSSDRNQRCSLCSYLRLPQSRCPVDTGQCRRFAALRR